MYQVIATRPDMCALMNDCAAWLGHETGVMKGHICYVNAPRSVENEERIRVAVKLHRPELSNVEVVWSEWIGGDE